MAWSSSLRLRRTRAGSFHRNGSCECRCQQFKVIFIQRDVVLLGLAAVAFAGWFELWVC